MADQPQTFGKYRLVSKLGVGGMAETWRAELKAASGVTKTLVIKRVLPTHARDKRFIEAFIYEARISAGLSHGNIAQVFDFGQADGEYFIAMEYVQGRPLSALLKKARVQGLKALPPLIAAGVAIELCKGLHYAHTRNGPDGKPLGIVHRDVSPENVLVSWDGEVKLVDFGVARAEMAGRNVTEPGHVKGKYLYFSPEQIRSQPLDGRSDVFATGVVLYRMLTGARPFDGKLHEVLRKIVEGTYVAPRVVNPDLPEALDAIVRKALATDRDERYRSALELQEALSRYLFSVAPGFTSSWLRDFLRWAFQDELGKEGVQYEPHASFEEQLHSWLTRQQAQDGPLPLSGENPMPSGPEAKTRLGRTRTEDAPPPAKQPPWVALGVAAAAVLLGLTVFALSSSGSDADTERERGMQALKVDPQRRSRTPQVVDVPGTGPEERIDNPAETDVPDAAPPPAVPDAGAAPPDERDLPVVEEVQFEVQRAPVDFVLARAHRSRLDDAPRLPRGPGRLTVVTWPIMGVELQTQALQRIGGPGNVMVPMIPIDDLVKTEKVNAAAVQRPMPLFLFERTARGVAVRPVKKEDRYEAPDAWLFAPTTPTDERAGQADIRAGTKPLNVTGLTLAVYAEDRFTVRELSGGGTWRLEVKVKADDPGTVVPAVLVAEPEADALVVLDGKPLPFGAGIVPPGRHTLRGARALWMTVPTVTGLEPATLEVVLAK